MPPSLSQAQSRPRSRAREWAAVPYLPEAILALVLVRLGLVLVGLTRVRSLGLPCVAGEPRAQTDPNRIARAVRAASRIVPFASCLTQAQAAQIVLARRGIASTVCLGVRETASGQLTAHAWLISGGRLLLGGTPRELAAFRQLAELAPTR